MTSPLIHLIVGNAVCGQRGGGGVPPSMYFDVNCPDCLTTVTYLGLARRAGVIAFNPRPLRT